MTLSDISIRHAHSGLEQLLVPAALVWPLNLCLESRCQKKRSVEKFPLFKLFCSILGESDPTGQLRGCVSLPEKPLCTLTAAQSGWGTPRMFPETVVCWNGWQRVLALFYQ